MEIKIDTEKDSKEHIRHMIEFLQRFVGLQASSERADPLPTPQEGMFNLFDNDDSRPASSEESDEPRPEQHVHLEQY
ncbi:hypothetical protein GF367_02160 [Candidatus Woesearchaeota archaeon]|nr:hypothetical protein [Candidatus Woesearchaeota archaeon]